jgi:hypothetical protein
VVTFDELAILEPELFVLMTDIKRLIVCPAGSLGGMGLLMMVVIKADW